MSRSTSSTPAGLRRAVGESVEAALAQDAERFAEAAGRLAVQDQQRLVLVQAGVIRALLEDLHPNGLSSADAQDVLRRCLITAASWYPQADPSVLVLVLTGALGLAEGTGPAPAAATGSDPDPDAEPEPERPTAGPAALSQGAALLIADLLAAAGAPLAGYLDATLAELERAETIELP
ncbi:MAG: hypothetical protein QOE23_2808 [Pseudonocardiales bacterium]|jgi:hypothetical protein|nr:hypothetical protein [Pseudonocardiales bacterium]